MIFAAVFGLARAWMSHQISLKTTMSTSLVRLDDIPYVLKYTGEDNLVIGTDYGHNETASEIEALRNLRGQEGIAPSVVDKILSHNPRARHTRQSGNRYGSGAKYWAGLCSTLGGRKGKGRGM